MAESRIELDAYLADPLAAIAGARERGWLADSDVAPMVVRYEDARRLLTEPSFAATFDDFIEGAGVTDGDFRRWMRGSPLNVDGEAHRAWRALLTRTFTPRSVERLRPRLATAAHELIDAFAARGACELVAEFSDPYPSIGLCELIGVPLADRDRFRGWANTLSLGFNPFDLPAHQAEIDDATAQLLAYATELVAARRADPRDDLVSRLAVAAGEEGGAWDDEAIAGTVAGLVFAGHDTTKNQLGWAVSALSGRPDLWDGIDAGTVELPALVDELVRHRSSVTAVGRTATAAYEHDGQRIEPGTKVLVSLWAANHDPAAFPRHDEVDVAANGNRPAAAFGHGAHHCIGANLARTELQVALEALASRITCPTVGDGEAWRLPIGITGPSALPLTFGAR